MKPLRHLLALTLATASPALLLFAPRALAQARVVPIAESSGDAAAGDSAAGQGASLSTEQRAFFRELALINGRRERLAAEASGRATRSDTRDFAAWIARESATFAEELATLARVLGDESAARATPAPQEDRPAWADEDDADYDEGYVGTVAELGGRLVEKLEPVSDSAESTVAAFARKHLPLIRSQVQRARDLDDQI